MELKDLNLDKASIEKLLEGVVEAAVDELYKADPIPGAVMAGGPVQPDHNAPGIQNDYAESDAVAAQEGVNVKAKEEDEEDDDKEDDDDEGNPFAGKSNTSAPDLTKSLMKSVIGMQKAITGLSEKLDTMAKGRARGAKSVTKEEDVEVIEKSNSKDSNLDELLKSNPRAVGATLLKMHTEGKVAGRTLTEYELFGANKLTDGLKKSVLAEADLVK
jgi:hypothetical protein